MTKQMLNPRRVSPLFIIFFLSLPALLSAGAANGLIIEHGPRTSRSIALTFDACPTDLPDEYDERVVDILIKEKVPATIFLSGRWVEKNPEKAKFLASQAQFEIAEHSFYHPHLLEKDDARVLRELRRTQAIIKKVTGRTPQYFRPPYGEVDERVATLAKSAGLTTINFDIASGDPDASLSPERIARVILRDARGGNIIVFHLNHKGVHTADALPLIIEGLRKKGFTLVTVGEMLKNDTQEVITTETRSHGERGKINNR